MAATTPFRFGAAYITLENWTERARKVEALGYDTLVVIEHPAGGGPSPLIALMAAASVTTTLRFSTHVLANDLHNPVLLAQDAATLDMLSSGRFELGLGAGWARGDYTSLGVPFEAPGVRVSRLEEAVALIKRLFQEERVTHTGTYYQVQDACVIPKPVQQPGMPLVIGGGGRRMLGLAAREADVVSIDPIATADGRKDFAYLSSNAIATQIGWIQEAAGARFDSLELHILCTAVEVTDDRRRGAEQVVAFLNNAPPMFVNATGKTIDEVLDSPRCLIGSVDQIVEDLIMRRERYGISYITVMDFPWLPSRVDALAPVVARLAGK
jgi:probable F420-dependent oxidoreductase